jgi:hypothetical protein
MSEHHPHLVGHGGETMAGDLEGDRIADQDTIQAIMAARPEETKL